MFYKNGANIAFIYLFIYCFLFIYLFISFRINRFQYFITNYWFKVEFYSYKYWDYYWVLVSLESLLMTVLLTYFNYLFIECISSPTNYDFVLIIDSKLRFRWMWMSWSAIDIALKAWMHCRRQQSCITRCTRVCSGTGLGLGCVQTCIVYL